MKGLFTFVFLTSFLAAAPGSAQDIFSPYYVVIGGFRNEENAQRFSNYAHEQNLPAVYAYHEERKIFYVYIRATQTKEIADGILKNLRESSVFKDAWVFNGVLSGSTLTDKAKPKAKPETKPVQIVTVAEPEKTEVEPVIEFEDAPVKDDAKPVDANVKEELHPVTSTIPVGRPFVFRLLNSETGDVVNGLVRLQEKDKAQQYRGYNGHEKVYVPAPSNRSGKWHLVCQVMGFRTYKKPVPYESAHEFEGATVGPDKEVIIPLPLIRVRRGDYLDMEHVKFFNNSALFTPGSERQLDELVAMMMENNDYEIRLHGHTNSNQAREIVSIGKSTNLFGPDAANVKSHETAKQLSLLRAELVKAYLIGKGINASRISTKGEGGKQMIFDPKGTLAGLNDRVEVEIRKH
jgi:outer membrane protein OmpA-like peptidoglycan-associated protein